jgi:RND family efflux transporter MFP subunit
MKRFLVPVLVAVVMAAGCGVQSAGEQVSAVAVKEPLAVKTAGVESRTVERSISVTGSLQPDETTTISNEIAGRLAVIHFDFGQRVRKGQVVAELDKRELQLQLDRMNAALAQTLARIGLTPEQVDVTPETTPGIRQAQAQMENARTKFESAAKLVKTGDIANDRHVELEKAYRAAEATLDAAQQELRVVLASVQSIKADVALAEKRLDDATIRAPFDGSVGERMASPGEYLRQNAPIVQLVKAYPLRLRADIPETGAAAVRVGTRLDFTTAAIPGERFAAVVREVNPSLDARSRSLSAEARLTTKDSRLRPGMFVQVEMVVQHDAEIVVVPKSAIRTVAGLNKVFTIEGGKAVERKVILGKEHDGFVEIREADFGADAAVAVDHLAELTDGAEVNASRSES